MIRNFFISIAFIVAMMGAQATAFAQGEQKSRSQQADKSANAKSITIHQEVDFNVSPQRLYAALLDTKQFCGFSAQLSEFTAMSAEIDPAVGGAFTIFDGHITGRNIELVPNIRIVQAWRVVDWPAGIYSIVKFEFKATDSGTHLVFDHTGFPEGLHDGLAAGWQSHYWDLLGKYLK